MLYQADSRLPGHVQIFNKAIYATCFTKYGGVVAATVTNRLARFTAV